MLHTDQKQREKTTNVIQPNRINKTYSTKTFLILNKYVMMDIAIQKSNIGIILVNYTKMLTPQKLGKQIK